MAATFLVRARPNPIPNVVAHAVFRIVDGSLDARIGDKCEVVKLPEEQQRKNQRLAGFCQALLHATTTGSRKLNLRGKRYQQADVLVAVEVEFEAEFRGTVIFERW